MSDLKERLRRIRGTQFTPYENDLVGEAADRIEALERALEKIANNSLREERMAKEIARQALKEHTSHD